MDGLGEVMTRSRATAKKAGTSWETEIVRALVAAGWPHAERRRLAGKNDRGDIAGIAGVVIEAKNTNELRLAEAMNEAEVEARNDGGSLGIAWLKRKGKSSADDGYAVMSGRTLMRLLREAGYQ